MNIKILKCTDPSAWYAKYVGETIPAHRFEVNCFTWQGIPEDVYWAREGGVYNASNWVRASDVERLP